MTGQLPAAPFALCIDSPNFASMSLPLRIVAFASASLVVSIAFEASAQVMPISWNMHVATGAVRQGKPFTVLVRAQIP